MAALTEVLARDDAAEVRELIRGLVEAIVLVPEDGRLRVEIRGELASILALAEGARREKGAGDTGALCAQIKMVAGNRSHNDLRRIEALAAQVNVVAGERNHLDLLFRAAA